MKNKNINLLLVFICLTISSCQSATTLQPQVSTETLLPSPVSTETKQPTPIPTITATFLPVSAKDLAGLIISSPILGTPQEHPSYQPSLMITPNGLGIINSEGELIKFTGAGIFESISPSGTKIVYQQGFEDEYYDYIDNLFIYNLNTGETTEILDDIENEGGKTIISWQKDEQEFIYYNDYYTRLFEAFGYFEPKQLLLADLKTGQTKFLTEGYQFDINPDNTEIAYTKGNLLELTSNVNGVDIVKEFACFQPYIYTIASSTSHSFDVNQLNEKPICLGYPKWSSDGKYIVWMGYFEDITFRPVIFDLKEGTAFVYDALEQKPVGSNVPVNWFFGDTNTEPNWVDNSTFWTSSYEVNIETGEILEPRTRTIELTYNSWSNYPLESFNKLFNVSMNEERDLILIRDKNENIIASYKFDDIYSGERYEIIQSGFHLLGRTHIVGWSPFAPTPNVGNP